MVNPRLKVGRAKEHLDGLRAEVAVFGKSSPFRVSAHDDTEKGKYVVEVRISRDLPDTIGLLAGDFICCLRASLDYLAWQLALLTTNDPFHDTCFPICDRYDINGGTEGYICSVTKNIPSDAVSIIRELQPYQSGDAYNLTYLWRLDRLWNIEKHRRIPIIGSITGDVLTTRIGIEAEIGELDDCHTVTIPLSEKPYVRLDPSPSVELQFGGEREGVIVTVTDLAEIFEFVSEKVMPRFAGFLPKDEPRGQGGIQRVLRPYRHPKARW
jgi:hypothetical protein